MKYTKSKNKNAKKPKTPIWLVVAVLVVLGIFIYKNKDHANFSPISIVANVAAADLNETDGRTNVLVLGSDRRDSSVISSELTDTILVASIGRYSKDVVLISIPRDLWVKDSFGNYMKVNSVYALDSIDPTTGTLNKKRGTDELKKVVENALGIPIHYHVLVNFKLFKDMVDLLEGINLTIDTAFTDYYYPIEGKENAPEDERYETVHFEAGTQTLSGEQALKFARSRHGNNNEGTDFARSRRQQKVIMAIKEKALSLQTLVNPQKLMELYNAYSKNVDTNIDLSTVQNFYLLSQQINFDKITSIVLDDRSEANTGGLLYSPQDSTLYGGAYVLIPRTGDYSQIHAYVQKYLFSDD